MQSGQKLPNETQSPDYGAFKTPVRQIPASNNDSDSDSPRRVADSARKSTATPRYQEARVGISSARRAAQRHDSESEVSLSDSEVEEKPKPKPQARPAPKPTKAKSESEDESEEGSGHEESGTESEEEPPKAKQPRPPAKQEPKPTPVKPEPKTATKASVLAALADDDAEDFDATQNSQRGGKRR